MKLTLAFIFSLALCCDAQNMLRPKSQNDIFASPSDSLGYSSGDPIEPDSSFADSTQNNEDREHQHVIRNYNHREQVIVGSVVMLSLALMLVSMNNYNPKR
jgi:hypothetical protein